MTKKLTELQRDVLETMQTSAHPYPLGVLYSDHFGGALGISTIRAGGHRVAIGTFNSLVKRGLIEVADKKKYWEGYRLTDEGRAALKD